MSKHSWARLVGAVVMGLGGIVPCAWSRATVPQAQPEAAKQVFAVAKGDFGVVTTDVTLHDAARNKDLELRVRVPKIDEAKGQKAPEAGWPLLVFSHGAGGSRDAFGGLQDLLASHGYVCIAPTHSDSIALRRRSGEGGASELLTPEGRGKLRSEVKLAERVADCVLIVDKAADISALAQKGGGHAFAVDRDRVAIAGHSAGAYTAQLCAGVKIRGVAVGKTGTGFVSIGDPRLKAAVIISGQGTASRALGEDSWSDLKIPIIVFTGSLDNSPPQMGDETPRTRQHPYVKSRGTAKGGPPAYLMFIEGATHSSYSGKRTSSLLGEKPATDAGEVENATNAAVLTFLDAHVLGDAKALEVLSGDSLARTIPGKVRYEHK
jgi:predicted dienelactone hydrolase